MITKISASTVVDAPLQQVYDQWTQFEDFPRFMSSVKQIEQVTDDLTRWDVEIGGVERTFDARIAEQVPDTRLRWESTDEKVHTGLVEFEALADGTRVTLTMWWMPEGFIEKVGSALDLDDRAVEKDLARFKEFIEQRSTPTGAWRGTIDNA